MDGSLSDWNAYYSRVLDADRSLYLYPGTPTPSASDLSARLWMICDGSEIKFAAIITDSLIYDPAPVGNLYVGDSMTLFVDGAGNGTFMTGSGVRPGQDDHDLQISSAGLALDYGVPLLATVVARTTPGSNWRVEMSVPISRIYTGIGSASQVPIRMSLWDRDTATPVASSFDQLMVGPSWTWIMDGVTE